jgi:D-glycerate 3-kinase
MSIDPRYLALFENWLAQLPSGAMPVFGISGAQGCGKSYLGRALAAHFGGACLSLDDVYLTRAERQELATRLHPMFCVRGVPTTHDLVLLQDVILQLQHAEEDSVTPLPAFDKLGDNRLPRSDWSAFIGRPRLIIVEGWCLGAMPIEDARLVIPINSLEREQDPEGVWRKAWNEVLAKEYTRFFAHFDAILHLKAPSFDVVLDWRCEQEEGLLGLLPGTLPPHRRAELTGFIAHFERLTRQMLAGGVAATAQFRLDPARSVIDINYGPISAK